MARARLVPSKHPEHETCEWEDPVTLRDVHITDEGSAICISDGDSQFIWLRASDAGVLIEWLAKHGGDWRTEKDGREMLLAIASNLDGKTRKDGV